MEIKVTLGHQYGQRVVHPACDQSRLFCEMVGSKTMPARLIDQIKQLGYRVVVVQTEPKEL